MGEEIRDPVEAGVRGRRMMRDDTLPRAGGDGLEAERNFFVRGEKVEHGVGTFYARPKL